MSENSFTEVSTMTIGLASDPSLDAAFCGSEKRSRKNMLAFTSRLLCSLNVALSTYVLLSDVTEPT